VSEWISVDSDEKPEDSEHVVGVNMAYGVIYERGIFWYIHKNFCFEDDGLYADNYGGGANITCSIELTHWCRMPTVLPC
jgi:hypothetical protein